MGNTTLAKNLEATITELGFTDSLSWSTQSINPPDTNVAHYPRLMYYYHPDYLGHVEYITDLDGLPPALSEVEVYQHFYYTAWGETLLDQKATRPGMNFDSPYRFNGKELDEETGLYYYGARYYNPTMSVWLGVDPLAAKYPQESPYLFCGGNPIIYIDPDGREKIIALDKKNEKDQTIIAGSEKYADDGAIHIFGHGNTKGMYLNMDGKKINIKNAEQLESFLSEFSETWKNKGEGDKPVIVLHSCNTGKDQKDGSASFAQQISESDLFKDATIVAPDEVVWTNSNGQVGTYKAKTDSDGEFKRNDRGSKIRSDETGSWRVFQGGKQTGQYRGDWKPKENPTLWDRLIISEDVK